MKLTFREIAIVAHGFNERAREDYKRQMVVARSTAWMIRCEPKHFPTLAQLIPGRPLTREERAEQNRERMKDLMEARNASVKRQERKARAAVKAEKKKQKAQPNG